MFAPISREKNRLRLAIEGPSGSGKTYTALRFAFAIAGPRGRVAVIDTEHGSAAKYEGESPDGVQWKFDGVCLEHFAPSTYEQVIKEAGASGYDVLVIDSLSHAWSGVGGALDQIDRSKSNNRFAAWKDVTPQQNAMIESIIRSPCHVIATMRSKMEYVLEKDESTGKFAPKKVGLAPIQRDTVEYEFDIVCDMDLDHTLKVSKTRCPEIDRKVVNSPTGAFIDPVMKWLFSGREAAPRPAPLPVVVGVEAEQQPAAAQTIIVAAASQPEEPKCGEVTAFEIKDLAQQLGWTLEKFKEVLSARGAAKVADLSAAVATDLAAAMRAKVFDAEGKTAPF